jgi:SAM-dependent methyltransferase
VDLTKRYEGLSLWSPLSIDGLESVLEALPERALGSALDLGCGNATVLAQLITLGRARRGVGLDRDPRALKRARKAIHKHRSVRRGGGDGAIALLCADASALPFRADTFELVCSIGGPVLMPTPHESLGRLAALVPFGGWLLHGDVVWRRPPKAEYLEALGDLPAQSISSALGRSRILDEAGLDIVAGRDSTIEEWDAFESRLLENVAALVDKHPQDDALANRLAAMRRWNAAQAQWGRGTMTFNLQLRRRPRPSST